MIKKINIGSSDGYLIIESDIKQKVIDYLYNSLDLSKYRYLMLDNLQKLKNLQDNEHYVSPNYKGLNYFLIFTVIQGKQYCVLIDRKKLSYHKNQVELKSLFIVKIFVNTNENIFTGSIFYGKMVQKDSKYYFLIQDCFYLMGKKITDMELNQKMQYLNDIIKTNFSNTNTCDNFTFKLNKLYTYNELPDLIENIIPNCGINNNGLIFLPKISGISILYVEKKIEKLNIDSKCGENIQATSLDFITNFVKLLEARVYEYEKVGKTKVLLVKKTNIPDVYNLYEINDQAKLGIGHIPNLKISNYLANNIFDEPVKMNCIFNTKFNKWIPLTILS